MLGRDSWSRAWSRPLRFCTAGSNRPSSAWVAVPVPVCQTSEALGVTIDRVKWMRRVLGVDRWVNGVSRRGRRRLNVVIEALATVSRPVSGMLRSRSADLRRRGGNGL